MALPRLEAFKQSAFKQSAFRQLPLVLSTLALLLCFARTPAEAQRAGCPAAERREALSALQAHVRGNAPGEVDSFDNALKPGGALAGWQLSHGYVVLAGADAIAIHNPARKFPDPQTLLYAPSPTSKPADWLDFDGPDGPYWLVGWAYLLPYQSADKLPFLIPCVTRSEWFVHEAGWHMRDGDMRLTPGETSEPPRPDDGAPISFWHPRHWDIHFWRGADGTPTVSFHNPQAGKGGLRLPPGAFFYIIDGRPWPEPKPRAIPVRLAD